MHQKNVTGIQIRKQVFGPTPEAGDDPPLQPLRKIALERKPQISAAELQTVDPGAFHGRLQAAPDGFDFGKLGHAMGHSP